VTENNIVITRGWDRNRHNYCLVGREFPSGIKKKVLELESGDIQTKQ
jgi:hypothetical protein